jgi:hypothetical protein
MNKQEMSQDTTPESYYKTTLTTSQLRAKKTAAKYPQN